MSSNHVLVVDDEPQIRRVLRTTLIAQGYQVSDARSGEDAIELIRSERYDLILLDYNMAGMSGIETCREIRRSSDIPILMVTVRGAERDKVCALDAGADGYVTKPFSISELMARIRAVLRRSTFGTETDQKTIRLGNIEIDFEARKVQCDDRQIHLTAKEFEVLLYLAAHPNKAIKHREILQAVWGPDYGDEQEYLRVFVNRLRKKLEACPSSPRYLLTEPWVGYRLELT